MNLIYASQDPQGRLVIDPVTGLLKTDCFCDCAGGGGWGGGGCTWDLDRNLIEHVSPTGDSFYIEVLTFAGCAWAVESSVPWMTVAPLSGLSGTQFEITVKKNTTSAPRTGYVYLYNTVAANGRPIGTVTADTTVEVQQDWCPEGLADNYTLIQPGTGIMTFWNYNLGNDTCEENGNGVLSLNDRYKYAGNLILNKISPCIWGREAAFWGAGFPTEPGSPYDFYVKKLRNVELALANGQWELKLWSWTRDTDYWAGPVYYIKTTGSTPIGVYTETHGCNPATLEIAE